MASATTAMRRFAGTSERGPCSSGIHFERSSCGKQLSGAQIFDFHFWSSRQRTTDARARTDAKNPFQKSKFRRSTPCFKGATSTRSVKSSHFLPAVNPNRPSNLFHGELTHKTRPFPLGFVPRSNLLFSGKAASFSTGPQWLCQCSTTASGWPCLA